MTDAEVTLRNLLKKLFSGYKDNITVKALTSGGENYTSALYKIEIPENGRLLKLFGKMAILSEQLREVMKADIMYSTEQFFYDEIIKKFKDIEEKYEIETRFKFPICYGFNSKLGEETIILEDLTAKDYCMYNRLESVDWDHSETAITNLANFHSFSFAYQREKPEEYENLIKKFKSKELSVTEDKTNVIAQVHKNAIETINNEEFKRRMQDFLKATKNKTSGFMDFQKPIHVPVLVHGDYRLSNLLFRRKDGVLESIVLDYQTVHTGSPAADLLYFIFTGTDEEFRKNHYQQLLHRYHKELSLALARFKINVNDVYPLEIFQSEIDQLLPIALLLSMVMLPIVTVEAASAPQIAAKDADVNTFLLKPNQLFSERFNGIIRDCVKWGVI